EKHMFRWRARRAEIRANAARAAWRANEQANVRPVREDRSVVQWDLDPVAGPDDGIRRQPVPPEELLGAHAVPLRNGGQRVTGPHLVDHHAGGGPRLPDREPLPRPDRAAVAEVVPLPELLD